MAILVLAAGKSSRMGTIKQLLPWNGTTLLGNSIKNACSVTSNVWVVLGANSKRIKKTHEQEDVTFIEHQDWENGLGSSLACGINELTKSNNQLESVLITLADQPLVDADYLNTLREAFDKKDKGIIATGYGERAGVPALFDKKYFGELSKLTEDTGAKNLIELNKNDTFVLTPKGKTIDLDTPEDFKKMKSTKTHQRK